MKKASKTRNISRRALLGAALASSAAATLVGSGRLHAQSFRDEYDYIVVGSGAGGGPLAANLARAGFTVLVLEAGEDDPSDDIHNIPAFHPFSAEDRKLSWDFFVEHYQNSEQARRDSKYVADRGGVLYPRAATLGGCTTHHALITVYPHNSDFEKIAQATGDASWEPDAMRQYFQRLERCQYLLRPLPGFPDKARHGFDGWLRTNNPDLRLLSEDRALLDIVKSTLVKFGLGDAVQQLLGGSLLDINDYRVADGEQEGPFITPLAADRHGRRRSVREYLKETRRHFPHNLHIRTNALAERVLFEGRRAVGVAFLDGPRAYKADPLHGSGSTPVPRKVFARREVILSGGAFNSPQLLKLSGIGPVDELRRHGIEPRMDLPGVGENLQDRYEVGVVSEMAEDLALLKSCTFGERGDPCLRRYRWRWWSRGPYASNGPIISLVRRSRPDLPDPDLYLFGIPADFRGYFPGYSEDVRRYRDRFSWVVLKGHTRNRAGRVLLRSASPQETPQIQFNYFEEGSDRSGDDLRAVVEGLKLSRELMTPDKAHRHVARELWPGPDVADETSMQQFVRDEAWGHHASCSNKMGPVTDPMAVVDSKFRVHGTEGLRVVDASVFPEIPGFFIVTPIYMISEKATDDILAAANGA